MISKFRTRIIISKCSVW